MVETGESRTPRSITKTVSNFESDPINLIPQLLDQIIALGYTAQQLRRALSGNGHRPETVSEIAQQLVKGSDHAFREEHSNDER